MENSITVPLLIQRMQRVATASAMSIIIYIVALTAIYVAVDVVAQDAPGSLLIISIAGFVGGYLLLKRLLFDNELPVSSAGMGAYFGLSLLFSLGVSLATILLIIPGLILAARWLPSYALLLAEEKGVSDTLGESWAHTSPSVWALLAVMLIGIVATWVPGFGVGGYMGYVEGPMTLANAVAPNLGVSLYSAYISVMSVAAYALIWRGDMAVQDVFS